MKFKKGFVSVLFGMFALMLALPSPASAYMDKTGCYAYDTTSAKVGQTTTLTLNDGSTMSIVNTSPASILQSFKFNVLNNGANLCLLYDLDGLQSFDPYIGASFVLKDNTEISFPYSSGYTFNVSSGVTIDGTYGLWRSAVVPTRSQDVGMPEFNTVYLFLRDFVFDGNRNLTNSSANEDAIINDIASTKNIKLNVQSSYLDTGFDVTAPATNCVSLGGTGPKKIVFLRTKDGDATIGSYLVNVNNMIKTLKTIDPYKSYANQFSFFVDLKKYDASGLPTVRIGDGYMYAVDATKNIFTSSCSNGSSELDIVMFNNPAFTSAWTFQFGKTVFLNTDEIKNQGGNLGITLAHELGHAIGGLNDEYVKSTTGDITKPVSTAELTNVFTNCSTYPSTGYRGADNKIYGSVKSNGCTYLRGTEPKVPSTYYRPSNESIMNMSVEGIPNSTGGDSSKFNVISCGYLVAGLMGQTPNKSNASSYWSTCLGLDTAGKGEISPRTSAPMISAVEPVSGSLNTYTVSGTGMTSTNFIKLTPVTTTSIDNERYEANAYKSLNSVIDAFRNIFQKIVPVANGQVTSGYYEINSITSTNGTSMTFTVPANVPDGTYKVSVSGENSDWTNTSYTVVVSGNGSGETSVGSGDTGTTPTTPTTPTTNDPTAVKYSCPSGYTLQADNTCYKAPTSASVSYLCERGGDFISWGKDSYTGVVYINTCFSAYETYPAKVIYTCSGATLSGTQCIYTNVTATKSCSTSGYTLNSTKTACVLSSSDGISCPTGYALQSDNKCTITQNATLSSAGNYTCPSGYYYTGDYGTNTHICTKTADAKGIITVSTTNVASTSIDISWTDAMNKAPYTIKTNIGGSTIATVTDKQYRHTNLVPGTSYCYVVYDSTGSNYSNKLCKSTVSVSVQTPVLSAKVPTKGAVTLSWTKVDDGTGTYTIERATGTSNIFSVLKGLSYESIDYIDNSVAPVTTYKYRVTYKTSSGINRTSAVVSVQTLAKPATPTLKASNITSDSINLTWSSTDGSSVTGYNLVETSPIKSSLLSNENTTSYVVSGLKSVQKYCFAISANIYNQKSATSTAICATTLKATVTTTPTTPVTTTPTTTTPAIDTSTQSTTTDPSTSVPTTPTTPTTTSIPASVSYSCEGTAVLSGTSCIFKVFTNDSVLANKTYTCPTGYTRIDTKTCKDKITLATTTTTIIYTCGSTRTLNPEDNRCYTTRIQTSPATQSYYCASGYTLNVTDNTCSIQTSSIASSTQYAGVFQALFGWLKSWLE